MRRSLDVSSWEAGEKILREMELGQVRPEVSSVDACDKWLKDCAARNLSPETLRRYKQFTTKFKDFSARNKILLIEYWDASRVRRFRESWTFAPITALKEFEKMKSFFRFCISEGWIGENPCEKIKPPKVREIPTLPFSEAEIEALLKACERFPQGHGTRLKAMILLLRYSGLRISDAVSLKRENLDGNRLTIRTMKTNTPVCVPLPDIAIEALNGIPATGDYFFWSGKGLLRTVVKNWQRSFRKLCKLAGIKGGHFHRLRDTLSVQLLISGVPIEDVATILGNSPKIVLKHYAPWVKERQTRLEERLKSVWLPPTAS